MKKLLITGILLIVIFSFAGSLSATSGNNIFNKSYSDNVNETRIRLDCYYLFDNPWQGNIEIIDCLYCLPKMVDNPRAAFFCYYGIE